MPRTALLAGATGLVGGFVLEELLGSDRYARVQVVGRRALDRAHPKLESQIVDFDRLGAHQDLTGASDVFCCLGTTRKKAGSRERFRAIDYGYPLALAKAARERGAEQLLVISSIGARASSSSFYLRVKGELESALRALDYRALHILRPSMLDGPRTEHRPGERVGLVAMRAVRFAMIGALRPYRPILAQTVARAMVRAAARGRYGVTIYESDEIQSLGG